MKRLTIGLMATLLLTAPTMAAGYIPIGPKIYTPNPPIVIHNPDIVTPQPDLVTTQDVIVSPATHDTNSGPSSTPQTTDAELYYKGGFFNPNCPDTIAYVNADCTALSINPGGGGRVAVTRTDTITTPQPDIVTPQPDTVIPQPDSCKRLGLGSSGLGYYSC